MALLAVVARAGSFTLVRCYAAELEALRPAAANEVPVVIPALPADRDCECATALANARFEVE